MLSFSYAVLTSIFVLARSITLQSLGWRGTQKLHNDMLKKVFNAPINLYFDVTPIGRILNKFSKDLTGIEREFAWEVGNFLAVVYQAISILIVAVIVVKWILVLLPILIYISYRLYVNSITSFRETTRLESLTKSPLLSNFGETFIGTSTIRTFGRERDFILSLNAQLNKNILASQWSYGINTWFSLRIDLISLTIMSFSSVFCLFYGEDDSSTSGRVYPVMLLTYVLLLQEYVLWTIKCYAEIEQRMVNVDRCLKILDIPQESQEGTGDYQKVLSSGWPKSGLIEFKNVFLRYRPNTEIVLRDLSFKVTPKEKLGIVGRTGSGKSTICLSLSRIVEIESGKILIDGVDVQTIPIKELRKRITVIPQVLIIVH